MQEHKATGKMMVKTHGNRKINDIFLELKKQISDTNNQL
jgi:hypothetical protein